MEDDQTRNLAAAKAGKLLLDDNSASLWDLVLARAAKRALLGDHIDIIEALEEVQSTDNTGRATNKKNLKKDAAEKALVVAKVLTVLAKDTHDDVLKAEIDFEFDDLFYAKDADAAGRWLLVFDRGNSNSALLISDYGVAMADITAVKTARLAFLAKQGDPATAKAARAAATVAIAEEFDKMRPTIESIKELALPLKATNSIFVNALNAAFKKNDSGNRKVNAVITYRDFDTGVVLAKVETVVVETGEKKKSSKLGLVQLKGEDTGNYTLVSKLKGYNEDTQSNFAIESDKLKKVEIKLKKI